MWRLRRKVSKKMFYWLGLYQEMSRGLFCHSEDLIERQVSLSKRCEGDDLQNLHNCIQETLGVGRRD